MRALFLLPLLLVLAACQSLARTGPDGFGVGRGGIAAYERDGVFCRMEAQAPLDSDVRLQEATRYARNRAYNQLFARCMTERGHPPRSYWRNVLPGG
ncbi:MAG: hypothetical protein BGN82_10205 [Alphaproteobacteria bacterium 65-7]|nr:MAG: hypothetical protein BGN82_10205 [Alphaproteobacteria bacterium 65-7]